MLEKIISRDGRHSSVSLLWVYLPTISREVLIDPADRDNGTIRFDVCSRDFTKSHGTHEVSAAAWDKHGPESLDPIMLAM